MKDFNLIEYIYTKEDTEINQTRIKQKKSINLNRNRIEKNHINQKRIKQKISTNLNRNRIEKKIK